MPIKLDNKLPALDVLRFHDSTKLRIVNSCW